MVVKRCHQVCHRLQGGGEFDHDFVNNLDTFTIPITREEGSTLLELCGDLASPVTVQSYSHQLEVDYQDYYFFVGQLTRLLLEHTTSGPDAHSSIRPTGLLQEGGAPQICSSGDHGARNIWLYGYFGCNRLELDEYIFWWWRSHKENWYSLESLITKKKTSL